MKVPKNFPTSYINKSGALNKVAILMGNHTYLTKKLIFYIKIILEKTYLSISWRRKTKITDKLQTFVK